MSHGPHDNFQHLESVLGLETIATLLLVLGLTIFLLWTWLNLLHLCINKQQKTSKPSSRSHGDLPFARLTIARAGNLL